MVIEPDGWGVVCEGSENVGSRRNRAAGVLRRGPASSQELLGSRLMGIGCEM